jgi:hypothetical protein
MLAASLRGEEIGWQRSMRINAEVLGRIIPRNAIVLSDRSTELRVMGNVNARLVKPSTGGSDASPLTWHEITTAAESGNLWGIVAVDQGSFIDGKYGSALRDITVGDGTDTGFRKRNVGTGMLVLEYVGGGQTRSR